MGETNALAPGIEIALFNDLSKYCNKRFKIYMFATFIINISYAKVLDVGVKLLGSHK